MIGWFRGGIEMGSYALLVGVLCLSMPLVAKAESAAERREALAQISEKLNDPDPFMRLAYMEEILGSGRAADTQIAVKMALSSADPELQSAGLRAYLASVRDLRLEISLPSEIQKELDEAAGNRKKERDVWRNHQMVMRYWNGLGRRLTLSVVDADYASGRFKVFTQNNLTEPSEKFSGAGSVVGSRVVVNTNVSVRRPATDPCSVDLSVGEGLILRGEMSCSGAPPLQVSMEMY
jgi:hypothetical protein